MLTKAEEAPWYFREEITSTYESWYEGKYKNADLQEKSALKKALDWMSAGSLLEVGCGTAHFTRWFEEVGIESYGADLSPLMLNEAKKLWKDAKVVRGESRHLPVRDRCVDTVALITCIEWMPNPELVLAEARRVARRGIVLGLMNAWSLPTIRRRIQVALGRNPFYKKAHFYSVREMKSMVEEVFGPSGYEISQRNTVFPRFVPLRESRIPLGAFLCMSIRFKETE